MEKVLVVTCSGSRITGYIVSAGDNSSYEFPAPVPHVTYPRTSLGIMVRDVLKVGPRLAP